MSRIFGQHLLQASRWVFLFLSLIFVACHGGSGKSTEYQYVAVPQAFLRDRVAAVFNKVALVKNGERLEIMEYSGNRRFARVRTNDKQEGWIELRYLVDQKTYDGFQDLARRNKTAPAQAQAITRADLNMHLEPNRDAARLYQLKEGSKVELLQRDSSEKPARPGAAPAPNESKSKEPPEPPMEDWWLVRDPQAHVGWVLGRMLDVDVPLEIAQYAEGQRIVASFVLDQVQDKEENRQVPQYLALLNQPKEGLSNDFDQIRVFTWNTRRHRYETAYRERNLNGMLPVKAGTEKFDEGTLPMFVVHVKDGAGNISQRKYKMNGVMVRRVLAPGEAPPARAVASRRRKKR